MTQIPRRANAIDLVFILAALSVAGVGPSSSSAADVPAMVAESLKSGPRFAAPPLRLPRNLLSPRTEAAKTAAIVTESGPLRGKTTPITNQYLGIPYAAPPVGQLRWTPPQPFGKWHGVLQATRLGNVCVQPNNVGGTLGSEDCLSLNIYIPRRKTDRKKQNGLPVMVWIHGGSLVSGAGGFYDPTPLVRTGNVIVVTINYRLGVLGFFAHPALDAEGHLNANYGLMDQQFALGWVQRNIANFGGNPNLVTIFGESGGGLSIYSNLASPTAAGLFHRAIAESGAYASFYSGSLLQFIVPLTVGESTGTMLVPSGTALAASAGCSSQTAQCLRDVSASTLVQAQAAGLYPFVDGTVLTQTPGAAIAGGEFNRVPVISGTNHDEYRLFVASQYDYAGQPLIDPNYQAAVAALFQRPVDDPGVVFLANDAYPLSNYSPAPPGFQRAPLALGALGTDLIFACSARNADISLSQSVPTFAYEFNDENAPLILGLLPASFPLGAYHASEVQYLFNILGTPATFSADQQQLSNRMIRYWTQFASTGDPNSAGAPVWSAYTATTDEFQSLISPMPAVESNFDKTHQCSTLWDTIR